MVALPKQALIYDGDCPFCSRYVKYVRLKQAVGDITLINARDDRALSDYLFEQGYNLDEGMALILDGKVYHGHDCINRLALLSTPSGLFNKVNKFIFSKPILARSLYPVLRAGRNATLTLLRRERIKQEP